MAVQTGRVVDLEKGVLRDAALAQWVLEAMCLEAEDLSRWDRDVKEGQDLYEGGLDNREEGVPYVQEGAASCDLAEGVHQDRQEAMD